MCSASTMHRALLDSGLKPGQFVVFPGGGGGVGIQGVQLAKAMGMRPIVIDTGAQKKKLSLEMGAEEFIDFREVEDPAVEVKRVAGGVGAHGVIVTAYQAYPKAISYIADRIGGVIMCVGLRKFSISFVTHIIYFSIANKTQHLKIQSQSEQTPPTSPSET